MCDEISTIPVPFKIDPITQHILDIVNLDTRQMFKDGVASLEDFSNNKYMVWTSVKKSYKIDQFKKK